MTLIKYRIKSGDTFKVLAKKYFDDESVYDLLAMYNKHKKDSDPEEGNTISIPPGLYRRAKTENEDNTVTMEIKSWLRKVPAEIEVEIELGYENDYPMPNEKYEILGIQDGKLTKYTTDSLDPDGYTKAKIPNNEENYFVTFPDVGSFSNIEVVNNKLYYKYIIEAGDTISAICTRFGYKDWKPVYDNEANTSFRSGRKSADNIKPNEQFFIPVHEINPAQMTTVKLPLIIYLCLDFNRDGTAEMDPEAIKSETWEWGKDKKGSIMMCNNDDDDTGSGNTYDGYRDFDDDIIGAKDDEKEVAPVVLKKLDPQKPVPSGWKIILGASDNDHVRIFESRKNGAKEIIGPDTGVQSLELKNLDFKSAPKNGIEFGIEALNYENVNGFKNDVDIQLWIKDDKGREWFQKAPVRVAPWIMPNHLDEAERVYVVDVDTLNENFRTELEKLVKAAKCEYNEDASLDDIWMQDCMEFGYSSLPNHGIRTVVRSPRDGDLQDFPIQLLGKDLGYEEVGTLSRCTFNSTGNLEVTPPATLTNGKKYPWGRIYYCPGRKGEKIDKDFKSFLDNQKIQKPIEIDAGWLFVGHVDEMISIVPDPGGSQKFKLLLASPRQALKILDDNKGKGYKLLDGCAWGPVNVDDFFSSGISKPHSVTYAKILEFNIGDVTIGDMASESSKKCCQKSINKARTTFIKELNLKDPDDIIEVPVLFIPNENFSNLADALFPDMVNMLVINNHCIVPKPFGPTKLKGKDLFEEDLKGKLHSSLTVNFLNDWEYHIRNGEVHCGTNTLRKPVNAKWWEFEP